MVAAFDRADRTQIAYGTLSKFDNEIDTTTGTIQLRALFDNADESLFPNQFVIAHLALDDLSGVVNLPTATVQYGTPTAYVRTAITWRRHPRHATRQGDVLRSRASRWQRP